MSAPRSAFGTLANLLVACLLAGALYVAPRSAEAGCRLYQERNYGGSAYTLGSLDRMKMAPAPASATPSSAQEEDGRVIYDTSWNNRISSFRLSNGCTLTLWRNARKDGAHLHAARSTVYVGAAWDNAASEALCQCQ